MKDPKIPDIPKKKEEKATKKPPIDELEELNDCEKAILNRMKGIPAPKKRPDWISVTVGQRVSVAGLAFKISHISKGFLVLELDSKNTPDEEEYTWEQLKCTGAKSLIRIDGTPFFVETRVLTAAGKKTSEGK